MVGVVDRGEHVDPGAVQIDALLALGRDDVTPEAHTGEAALSSQITEDPRGPRIEVRGAVQLCFQNVKADDP